MKKPKEPKYMSIKEILYEMDKKFCAYVDQNILPWYVVRSEQRRFKSLAEELEKRFDRLWGKKGRGIWDDMKNKMREVGVSIEALDAVNDLIEHLEESNKKLIERAKQIAKKYNRKKVSLDDISEAMRVKE